MKKTLLKALTLLIIVLVGCTTDDVTYSCTKGVIRILNKQKSACTRGGGDCFFEFYLYDGKSAYWCKTDKDTWFAYNINDTLPTLVITKSIIPIK